MGLLGDSVVVVPPILHAVNIAHKMHAKRTNDTDVMIFFIMIIHNNQFVLLIIFSPCNFFVSTTRGGYLLSRFSSIPRSSIKSAHPYLFVLDTTLSFFKKLRTILCICLYKYILSQKLFTKNLLDCSLGCKIFSFLLYFL